MPADLHFQPGENTQPVDGAFPAADAERVIRRMVMEAIQPLAEWAQSQDALTCQMVTGTARKKSLYEHGTGWETVLEKFLRRQVEIIRLAKPLDFTQLLATGKNFPERIIELGDEAENTLLALWHQDHGVLAITWPELDAVPAGIRPLRTLRVPALDEHAVIWAWDRRNFPQFS